MQQRTRFQPRLQMAQGDSIIKPFRPRLGGGGFRCTDDIRPQSIERCLEIGQDGF